MGLYLKKYNETLYLIDKDNHHSAIDPDTLCQLITEIDGVKIYIYDCFVTLNNDIVMLYYNDLGLLLIHTKYEICIADYQDVEKIKHYNFICNHYDGEEYLLNKIKELENG